MKKIAALILIIVFCIGLVPALSVSAADVAVENVAVGKALYPSSTMGGYSAAAVTDGNYNTIWARGNLGANEHMMIDLGEAHRITSVVIHPRLDVNQDMYRQRIAVEFSNTPDFSVKERILAVGDDPTPYGEPIEVTPSKTAYRYVRVIKTDIQILVLAEIEIFGYIPDPNATNLGEDVPGSRFEGAVSLLSYLGTMDNVNEEIFGIDHLMTRGEAADAVVRSLGGIDGFTVDVPFSDVPKEHRYYDSIAAAYHMGYISGDGNAKFRPDDYVTEKEFTYMVMRSIGYSEGTLGSSAALMQYCNKYGILDNVEGDEESGLISRGNAAVMIYNALLAPTIETSISSKDVSFHLDGSNTLYKKFGITLTKGVVQETTFTRVDGDEKTNDSGAEVSGRKLIDKKGILDDFLGREVIYATHKDNDDAVVLAWLTNEDEVVTLKDSELVSTLSDINDRKLVAVDENDRDRTYSFERIPGVVLNGEGDPYWEPADLMPEGGTITLINNDDDRLYDVLFVDTYTVHYLNSVVSTEEEMTIVDSDSVKKVFELDGLKVTDGTGKALSASKVKKGSVIKLFETPSGEKTRIVVFSDAITGKLISKNDETFTVDGEKYQVSVYYDLNRPEDEPSIGLAVKFYVDENGEVIWFERDTGSNGEWVIAFSQAAGSEGVLSDSVRMKMFDEKGTWNIYEVADKIRVDGDMKTEDQFADMISAAKNSGKWIYEKSFVRFKTNDSSEIREIDTTYQNTDAEEEFSMKLSGNIASGLYSKESGAFWSNHTQIALVANNTTVFTIPTVGGQYTTDADFDDLYRVSATVESVAGNRSSQAQSLDMYMPDENGAPAFLAKKQGYSTSTGGLTAVSSDSAANIVVTEVSTEISDTEIVFNIKGKNLSTQADVSFYADENLNMIEAGILFQEKYGTACFGSRGIIQVSALSSLSDAEKARYISPVTDLGPGDIIRFETMNLKARALERVFDYEFTGLPDVTLTAATANPQVWFAANGTYPEHYIAFNRYQLGDLSNVTSDSFTITSLKGADETYMKSSIPTILSCTGERALAIEEEEDLYEFTDGNYKVIIFSYNASPKTAIVYEYAEVND